METNNKKPQKRYDEGFKRSAVEMVTNSNMPLKQIARELDVTPSSLRSWRKRLAPVPPAAPRPPAELEAQIRELQKELLRVKTQRDI